jgi:putative PIN family toxin of toxin-antitoxin system
VIRAVLDANVLAPGFLSGTSGAARLLDLWQRQAYELVVSEHLLDELAQTYADPYFRKRIAPVQVDHVLRLLRRRAIVTELTIAVRGVATQPEDDLVLATALSAGATYLATRDRQLLKLATYRGLQIVPPGRLLAVLEAEEEAVSPQHGNDPGPAAGPSG